MSISRGCNYSHQSIGVSLIKANSLSNKLTSRRLASCYHQRRQPNRRCVGMVWYSMDDEAGACLTRGLVSNEPPIPDAPLIPAPKTRSTATSSDTKNVLHGKCVCTIFLNYIFLYHFYSKNKFDSYRLLLNILI